MHLKNVVKSWINIYIPFKLLFDRCLSGGMFFQILLIIKSLFFSVNCVFFTSKSHEFNATFVINTCIKPNIFGS